MQQRAATPEEFVWEPGEAELVRRAKERSPEAWTEIYRAYYRPIYRYIRARVFDESAAEDLASAVFPAALKGIDCYRFQGKPLLPWLYRIARNTAGSYQRRLLAPRMSKRSLDLPRRVVWYLMRGSFRDSAASEGFDPKAAAASEGDPAAMVERMDLRNALQKVTPSQREIVILRFFVSLNTEEIAQVLGKKSAAVYSLQARALGALRQHLE
ncbi:MAG: sigma-70 family RNA polymerase sigma factor [Dehalococcoidia bacterium]